MKKIEDFRNLDNKRVLLRLDLNVPLNNNQITDSTRIDKILPTLNYLLDRKCKIIVDKWYTWIQALQCASKHVHVFLCYISSLQRR